ncbi:MAG TPA: hypothetical protein VL027_08865 [Spongiibacteraceae bacterium]|jgi:cell division protein FtsB|nr:hypothetical protein [Spongiibacteraceae bacterium]HUH38042.1 hypothetical protein [Spongiibacteraceae bacterium]
MPLVVIALVAVAGGTAIGYWVAYWRVSARADARREREQAELKKELAELSQQVDALRQAKADLEYQLGEERKARRHAEQGRAG